VSRLAACVRNDVRLQWRSGLYAVYVLLVITYAFVLSALEPDLLRAGTTFVIFADPAALGFFFLGGLMLLERGDGVLEALFAGPLRASEYIAAKGSSLTCLALLSSTALVVSLGIVPSAPLLLILGVALTSLMITFFAVAIGSRLTTVNRYFFGGALLALPLIAPLFAFVGIASHPLLAWMPAAPGLALIDAGLGGPQLSPGEIAGALAQLLAWTALMYLWALRWFRRFVIGGRR